MKKAMLLLAALSMTVCLGISAAAAEPLAEDRNTHGDWVGNYGKDGYLIFNSSVDTFSQKLPEYVNELSYTDLFEFDAAPHAWWSGTDGTDLEEPAHASDALWTDESKTERVAPAIYSGDGLLITVDTGDVTSTVSLYSLDWDDNGRVMLVTVYDSEGKEIASKEVTDFQKGLYLSTEITGKAVFEFVYLEATNMDSASNAVVAGVFFDSALTETSSDNLASSNDAAEPAETEVPTPTEETSETEPSAPVEEAVETEAAAPVEEAVETEAAAPVEETVETEAAAPVEEAVETEAAAPVEETVETEAAAPVEEIVETAVPAPVETIAETAPQTYDISAVFAVMTGVFGIGLTAVRKRK